MRTLARLALCVPVVLFALRARADEEEAVKVYRTVSPAVVALANAEGSGTGVIVGADGLILTNAHVVTSPLPFTATVDVPDAAGKTREVTFKKVTIVGFHPKMDLALVKVDPAEQRVALKPAQVARAQGQPGQRVYVIGNPAAGRTVLTKSITSGMLSAADRQVPGEPGKYYQVDAAINPGNSGGPMCDREGRVLGIVTFKFTDASALGFAIPLYDQEIAAKAFVPLNKRAGDPARSRELWKIADRYGDLGDRAAKREGHDSDTAKLFHLYAAMCYRQALMADPGNPVLYENVGTMLRHMEEYDAAIGYLARGIQLAPWGTQGGGEGNANSYRELGLSHASSKKIDQALAVYTEGVTKFPYADKLWEDLAVTYIGTGKHADAAEAATIALMTAQRGLRVEVMKAIVRDAREAAEKVGTVTLVDARTSRTAVIAKLDRMLSESNAARKAKRAYVTPAFAALMKDVGGPEIPGVEQAIPPQPRERLPELAIAEPTPATGTPADKPNTGPVASAQPKGNDWIGAGATPAPDTAKPGKAKPGKSTGRSGTGGATATNPPGDGWIGSDGGAGPNGKAAAIKPQVTGRSVIQGRVSTVVDAQVSPVEGKQTVGAVWSRDGKFIILADKQGLVRKISVPDLTEERRVALGSPCGGLALGKGGLIAAMTGIQEVWVLDDQTLDFKKRATAPKVHKVTAAPNTEIAYADMGPDGLTLVNTETGQVAGQVTGRELRDQRGAAGRCDARFFFFELSPDGRYIFCEGGECLHRLRVQGTKLIFEEIGPRIGANVQSIVVSPDSRYVCMPSGGGNGDRGYSTYVYTVNNLQKQVITITSDAYPQALGFDFPAKQLYAQNHDTPLMVFTPAGLKGKEYKFRDAGSVHRFMVYPQGRKVLLMGDHLWWVELPD